MMDRIIEHTEGHQAYRSIISALEPVVEPSPQHVVSAAAADVADAIGAKTIVAFTSNGTTATRIARKRPEVQVISLTPNLGVARRLALLWGAHSVRSEDVTSYSEMVEKAVAHAAGEGFAKDRRPDRGDRGRALRHARIDQQSAHCDRLRFLSSPDPKRP